MKLNRVVAPSFLPIEQIEIQEPESIKYANGLQVFTFQTAEVELLKFEFVFANIFDSTDLIQLNTVLASMLREGTKSRTSAQIANEIDFYGAYLIPEYGFDHTTISLYTMRKYAQQVLPVVHDVLCNSIFPEKELEDYKRNSKQSLAISLQKNAYLARRLFFKEVFGKKSNYGFSPTNESLDATHRQDLLDLFRKQMVPRNCTLFIAGNLDHDVLSLVSVLFGDQWTGVSSSISNKTNDFTPKKGQLLFENRSDSLQSAIRLGQLTVGRNHEDYPAIQFVNTLFGGFFGSRLMRNIRENKGYTYSISSGVIALKYAGFMTILTEVGVEYTQNTLSEIEKEMDILRSKLAPDEELNLVRNFMQGGLLGSMESIFSHVDKFKAVYFSNMTLDYYTNYFEVINTIDSQRVKAIAEQYFDYDQLVKVVVGA